jgi:hypothetical protein
MGRIVVIHFQPPELYPPVMNFINCREASSAGDSVDVFTTYCHAGIPLFVPSGEKIRLHRMGARSKRTSAAGRAWHYIRFYLFTLLRIIALRPSAVFYFETFSAFPACIYKRFINRRSRLFIHYHEYMTNEEYEHGMRLIRWFHQLEKKIYGQAEWVSHTNEARMKRFLSDLGDVRIPHPHTLPNYPPAAWTTGKKREIGDPVRVVYVGACSLDTMYTKAFAGWILEQKGKFTWDIYSLNITEEARMYLRGLPGGLVNMHEGVSYYDLPVVLAAYDVGVILYTGHIPNWIDNAPNKLFEYLSCGLDVWLPDHMTGSLPYIKKNSFPKVLSVDFQKLGGFDVIAALDRKGIRFEPSEYRCEDVYRPLWRRIAGTAGQTH